MKKVWKWVIGIVIVLVVIAAVVGGVFLLRSHFANVASITRLNRPGIQVPGNGNGQRFPGMRSFGNNTWRGRGMFMRGFGLMGFGRLMPFGGIIGGLFLLGILALIVLGIIWLVRSLRKPATVAAPAANVAQVAPPVAPIAPVAAVHSCPKCGELVQEGWKHCPNCGEQL